MHIKGLRAIAAGQRATASVTHKVTGLAGEPWKRLAIKEIAGATFPRAATFVAPLAPRLPLQVRRRPERLPPHEPIVQGLP